MATHGSINLFGFTWEREDSYGRKARELRAYLMKQGMHVNAFGHDAPKGVIRTVVGGILFGYPSGYHLYGPLASIGPRIAICPFESAALPIGWADAFNHYADAVIVHSRLHVDVYKDSGVTVPVHYVPLGVSKTFKPVERKRETGNPFTFLAFADRGYRKGWDIAGQAFYTAFGDDPNYRLIFKSRPDGLGFGFNNANIDLIAKDLTDRKLAALYADADCLIFPTRGEGFGLPPREFAATGGTVIATNWAGTSDDIAHWGVPLGYQMTPAWKGHSFQGCGEWAEPNKDELAGLMRHVAAHPDYYRERGLMASAFVRKHYTWKAFGQSVARIWQEVCDGYRYTTHTLSA